MKLKKIIDNLNGVIKVDGNANIEIREISSDSKKVREGFLFVAVKGAKFDGADFIDEAVDRGVSSVLVELDTKKIFKKGPAIIYVKDAKRALADCCKIFYDDISSKMCLIGITGTNGKTTITYLIESLFKVQNKKAGVIGTINYRFGNRLIPAVNTTPGILEIHSLLNSMQKDGINNSIMEISSHSLEQGRVEGLAFNMGIFTNLTSEHMDFHKNMQDYLNAKLKLFSKIKEGGYAIVNVDDPASQKIIEKVSQQRKVKLVTYGIENQAMACAKNMKYSFRGLEFDLCVQGINHEKSLQIKHVSSDLIGRHNVYNILAASMSGLVLGMSIDEVKAGIETLKVLPGRLERVDCGQGFAVFVDYAHTENGMENVLKALIELKPNRLISVFGCGGDRDRSKRPLMGNIAARLSDKVFITSDNPRGEDPKDIIDEIVSGIESPKNNYVIEIDRFNAIKKAIEEAKSGDIVLIAGKGHETYQIFKNITMPFDDREVVRRLLTMDE